MLKILLVSAAAVIGTTGFAGAQTAPHHMMMKKKHKVLANGRCNGISYGTGARRCGTASGGPVGGLGSRN